MSNDAWGDLKRGLELLEKHETTGCSPFHREHDELWVMSDPSKYTAEELAELDELGFRADEDYGCFKSFRFGSA